MWHAPIVHPARRTTYTSRRHGAADGLHSVASRRLDGPLVTTTAPPTAHDTRRAPPHTLTTLAAHLRQALGADKVFHRPEDVIVYEYDYGIDRGAPDLVALPTSSAEVQSAVRLAYEAGVPVIPRGAGTGIAGGAIPHKGGLLISLARMKAILEIDRANRCAVVQPV